MSPSQFHRWVRELGFEQSVLGKWLLRMDERWQVRRIAILAVFGLLLASFIFKRIDFGHNLRVGAVASVNVKSPISMELIDELATEEKRREAESQVPPVFDLDADAYDRLYDNTFRAFSVMRREARLVAWPDSEAGLESAVKDFLVHQATFERELGRAIPVRLFQWLVENRFSPRIENMLVRALAKWSGQRLVDGATKYIPEGSAKVLVRVVKDGQLGQEFTLPKEELKEVSHLENFTLEGVRGLERLSAKEQESLLQLAQELLVPTVTYNLKETTERRQSARASVLPVQRRIEKGQVIISEGQVVQPIHLAIVNEIRDLKSARKTEIVALASAALFVLVVLVFLSYVRRFTVNRVVVTNKDLAAMGVVTLVMVGVLKLMLLLADQEVLSRLGGGGIPASALYFLAPLAAGPMLIGMLVAAGEVLWLYTLFLGIVASLAVDLNYALLAVTMVGGAAAGRGVFGCKERNDIYWAGIRVGLVNAATILLFTIIQRLGDPDLPRLLVWNVPAGFLSGILAAILAMGLVPMLESAFNYTTDLRLLELASLNHPLMKEMIVRAPGTYHHSLVVGSMCEAAAEEIGANPLLAKVMAYYHDIGKMNHAQYFIENQRQGHNPHDHISPHMSKTILVAHVKDGAEMGLEHRLGKPIIDGILQHHGTTLISFFYNKALEEEDQEMHQIEEEEFRYPGPKPQFREAALVMLADSIEAAARSLDEPTAGRLQNIVKNVIQNKFLDGQLEECNLTLRDLTVIEESFKRILLGIYHHRIDYPMRFSATRSQSQDERHVRRGSGSA